MFNEELRHRSFKLTIDVILFLRQIPDNQEHKIIKGQLIRSVSSMAANFRASCTSRSKNEWYSKMCIVVEETDETLFWIEILENLIIQHKDELEKLKEEAQELVKIFSKVRGKVKS
ncbi:MAG: four helix bundle protein [Saprospiraceae bacterium]|nr:four helix bundle protein [Saprospiraceae bacterium]